MDALAPDLDHYHLFHAARATTFRELERTGEAEVAFERAATLAVTEQDRRFLARQIE